MDALEAAARAAAADELAAAISRGPRLRPLGPRPDSAGEWVGALRLAPVALRALDGDTIGGLVVDGRRWPPLRLIGLDAPELHPNAHRKYGAERWAALSPEEYWRTAEGRAARAARDFLQRWIDAGIVGVELNAWRGAGGRLGERVDRYGRILGRVYCVWGDVGAALVAAGHARPVVAHGGRRWPSYWRAGLYMGMGPVDVGNVDEARGVSGTAGG